MRIREMDMDGLRPVEGYGPGFFRIGGQVIEGPMLVTAETVRGWGGLDNSAPLLALAGGIDVLFLGTGAAMAHLPAGLRDALEAAGIGVETMTSPSACRTYNLLLAEGRRVALAALPV